MWYWRGRCRCQNACVSLVLVSVSVSVDVSVAVGSLYRERVETSIKSEWVREEVFMIESRPSGRYGVLTSQLQSQVASCRRVGVVTWWCDAMRCNLINAKLHFPMPSSHSFPAGSNRTWAGTEVRSIHGFTNIGLLTNTCNCSINVYGTYSPWCYTGRLTPESPVLLHPTHPLDRPTTHHSTEPTEPVTAETYL